MKRLLIAFALLTPLSVNAPSFDTQKAQADDVMAICAPLTPNDIDLVMHTISLFLKGWFARGSRSALQDAKQSWAKQRQHAKSDLSVLSKAYNASQNKLAGSHEHIVQPF